MVSNKKNISRIGTSNYNESSDLNLQSIYNFTNKSEIEKLIEKIDKGIEFEVSINKKERITLSQYIDICNYLFKRSKTNTFIEDSLDISYKYDSNSLNNYRITINGIERINRFLTNVSLRKNNSIFSIFVNNILNQKTKDKDFYIIHKIKDDIVDESDYDIRFRLAYENEISQDKLKDLLNIDQTEKNKIIYRYKRRLSYIQDYDNFNIRIDLTEVRQSMNIDRINDSNKLYELELEVIPKKKSTDKLYESLLKEIYMVHQVLQKSSRIIGLNHKNEVVKYMKKLLFNNPENDSKDLPAMQSESLENQHVVSNLTTNYSVTDKADGERYFLIIHNKRIYLISNNLQVKEIENSEYNVEKYNDTIIDGEYVYLPELNKFLFLAFDIIMIQGKDIRSDAKLKNRIEKLHEVLKECFNINNFIKEPSNTKSLDDLIKHYKNNIFDIFNELNDKLTKNDLVIMGKAFIIPNGLYPAELYAYADLIWNLYTTDTTLKCPYNLDGLMFTPIEQIYTRNLKEIKHKIYKWKPKSHNSIDFYITFEKNPDSKQIINVYDNSVGKDFDEHMDSNDIGNEKGVLEDISDYKIGNKLYRICNLQVGSTKNGIEQPVLFGVNNNLYLCYLYLQDGEARDIEGNIIQDETVVEFSYNNDPSLEHPYRWIALRTRFDKTETVKKYKRKYGNHEFIADKVWRSILSPFDLNDIKILANNDTHENYMINVIRPRVTKEDIVKERTQNIYYQKESDLARPMRDFHNFIKSNIVYVYCNQKFLADKTLKKLDHLELGMGRGGELMKLYHARVNSIVGFDIDYEGMYSATNGIISRYQTMKRKYPGFPKSTFLIADATNKLNFEDQNKSMGIVSDENKSNVEKIFGKNHQDKNHNKFDIFSCQFMIHYCFKNDDTLNNFCSNVNKYLNKDGFLLITTVDGKLLNDSFVNDVVVQYYTDNGKKKKLFEYVKKYNDTDTKKTGLSIDFFLDSFMVEGTYQTEYIVDPTFIINELETKCDVRLVDTDSFENQFYINKHFFENNGKYEANDKTKNFFMKIKEFYNFDDEINKNSFELTKLYRYFIFQKNYT